MQRYLPSWDRNGFCIEEGTDPEDGRLGEHCDETNPVENNGRGEERRPAIRVAGSYKIALKIRDKKLFAATHDGRTSLAYRSVERWLNTTAEAVDLFDRWAAMGISAGLVRYIGR